MSEYRKHTKFELCDRHVGWRSEGRYRLAEFFCEGGDGDYCAGGLCRCHPGRDLFVAELCCTFGELAYNWDRWPGESEGAPWEPFAAVEEDDAGDELETTCEARGLRHGQARYLVRKIQRGRVREAYAIRCPDDTFAVYSYEAPQPVRV